LAIDVVVTGTRDATTEPLIVTNDATGEPVWAIRDRDARDASVGAGVVLAGETRHAIIGIVATGGRSKAPADLEVARVVWVAAIAVSRARATWKHEATLEIVASCLVAFLACGAGIVIVAEVLFIGAPQAKRAGATAGPRIEAAVRNVRVRAACSTCTAIQIDARIASSILVREGGGITTANRRRNGQQHASKESHGQGAAGQPRL